jgi:hypothetical protein
VTETRRLARIAVEKDYAAHKPASGADLAAIKERVKGLKDSSSLCSTAYWANAAHCEGARGAGQQSWMLRNCAKTCAMRAIHMTPELKADVDKKIQNYQIGLKVKEVTKKMNAEAGRPECAQMAHAGKCMDSSSLSWLLINCPYTCADSFTDKSQKCKAEADLDQCDKDATVRGKECVATCNFKKNNLISMSHGMARQSIEKNGV